jgi:hypothetical protein
MKKYVPEALSFPTEDYIKFFKKNEFIDLTARLSKIEMIYLVQFLTEIGFRSYEDAETQLSKIAFYSAERLGIGGDPNDEQLVQLGHFAWNASDLLATAEKTLIDKPIAFQKAIIKCIKVVTELIAPKLLLQLPPEVKPRFQKVFKSVIRELENFDVMSKEAADYFISHLSPPRPNLLKWEYDIEFAAMLTSGSKRSLTDKIKNNQNPGQQENFASIRNGEESQTEGEEHTDVIEPTVQSAMEPMKDRIIRNGEYDKAVLMIIEYMRTGTMSHKEEFYVVRGSKVALAKILYKIYRNLKGQSPLDMSFLKFVVSAFSCYSEEDLNNSEPFNTRLASYMSRG